MEFLAWGGWVEELGERANQVVQEANTRTQMRIRGWLKMLFDGLLAETMPEPTEMGDEAPNDVWSHLLEGTVAC